MPAITCRRLVVFALLAALAQAASAQRQGTKDDLRQCMATEDQLKADEAVLRQKTEKHQAALKQFQQEMQAHVAQQATIDMTDEKAVTAFNERTNTLNAQVDVINKEALVHQAGVNDLNARMHAHNTRCAGMVYRVADMQAVAKERAAAAKAKAAKPQ